MLINRLIQIIGVSIVIILLFTGFLSYGVVRTDVYVRNPGSTRLQLLPRESFTSKDVPVFGYLLGEEEINCYNIVQTQKPQMLFDHWQVYQKQNLPMFSAWGAFHDTRSEVGNNVVRIFAVSEAHADRAVLCQLWSHKFTTNVTYLVVTKAEHKVIGRGYRRGKSQYFEYLYTCHIPRNLNSYAVSLAFERCENSTINLPIITPEKPETYSHQYGICIPVAYNRIDPARVIEWIELNKILGVTEINIYNSDLVSDTLAVLKHYETQGMVKVHNAPPPLPSWDYWPKKLAVIAALNDCMYRNMYRYNHTIVIDFDEVIVPQKHLTYDEMFENINSFHKGKHANRPALQFRNAYFFLDLPPDEDLPKALTSQRYRHRTKISPPGYSVKSITNPRKCVVMMNHYCRNTLPGNKGKLSMDIDPKFGLNQHYKKCHLGKECKKMLNETVKEDTMLRYKAQLTENVKEQYKKLNMTFN